MKYLLTYLLILCFACLEMSFTKVDDAVWGFYGHRKINRMAVFTLPQDMLGFYKRNIEFITEHAVDPDKRRYAIKEEAVRHYIDIDHWGEKPFETVPREFEKAFWKYADVVLVEGLDTSMVLTGLDEHPEFELLKQFYKDHISDTKSEGEWVFDGNVSRAFKKMLDIKKRGSEIHIKDNFSGYGILPYHMHDFYWRLVQAFNCLTNWEYMRFGKVEFLSFKEDMHSYMWSVVEDSHALLDSVLSIEKRLSIHFPENQQFCFDERLERTVRVQCPEYAEAYQNEMDGMVEQRMRDAVKSLGSVWYSAWIEAGSPDLSVWERIEIADDAEQKKLDEQYKEGNIYGREH